MYENCWSERVEEMDVKGGKTVNSLCRPWWPWTLDGKTALTSTTKVDSRRDKRTNRYEN